MSHPMRKFTANLVGFSLLAILITGCGADSPNLLDPKSAATDKGGRGGPGCTGTFEWAAIIDPAVGAQAIADYHGWCVEYFDPLSDLAIFRGDTQPQKGGGGDPGGVVTIELNNPITGSIDTPGDAILGIWDGETEAGAAGPTGMEVTNVSSARGYADGRFIRIAIIDTGINSGHPLLTDQIDYGSGTKLLTQDTHGHGTAVAGIIAYMAPRSILMPISVFDPTTGRATPSDVITALGQALADGADIVNMSIRFTGYSPGIASKLSQLRGAGVEIFVAAGNVAGPLTWPASESSTHSVTSTDDLDVIAPNVASGADYAGPGIDILGYGLGTPGEETWSRLTGTSAATAVASGMMALYLQTSGVANFDLAADLNAVSPVGTAVHGRVDGGKVLVPFKR